MKTVAERLTAARERSYKLAQEGQADIAKAFSQAQKICLQCHDARACPNIKTCCGGRMTFVPQTPCPQGKFTIAGGRIEIR